MVVVLERLGGGQGEDDRMREGASGRESSPCKGRFRPTLGIAGDDDEGMRRGVGNREMQGVGRA